MLPKRSSQTYFEAWEDLFFTYQQFFFQYLYGMSNNPSDISITYIYVPNANIFLSWQDRLVYVVPLC